MVTATPLSADTDLSMAGALASVAVLVAVLVAEGVLDEPLVHGLAGAEVSAGGDIPHTGEDPMDPVMGPRTLALIPQAPRTSSVCSETRPVRSKTTSKP